MFDLVVSSLVLYRVARVLADLGWADLDLGWTITLLGQ